MKTNKLSRTARRFFKGIDIPFSEKRVVKDLTDMISALPGVTLRPGYAIGCLLPGSEGMGGHCILFARDRNVAPLAPEALPGLFEWRETALPEGYLDVMDALSFEDTEKGVWSAFLVRECWRFLPLWWHANYAEQKWLLDADGLLGIMGVKEAEIEKLRQKPESELEEGRTYGFHSDRELLKAASMNGDESLLPSVSRRGDSGWELRYVFFSGWGGLVQTVKGAVCEGGRVSFDEDEKAEILVGYDCGIMF